MTPAATRPPIYAPLPQPPIASAPSTAVDRPNVEPAFNALRRLVHTLYSASRETERRLGVTAAQLFVLTQLRVTPSLSINALAERTMTHQSTVSVVVRRLVSRKLVRKVRSPEDRRRVELTLTPAGTALLRRAPEVLQVRLADALERLPAEERATLTRAMTTIVIALGGDAQAPPAFLFERSS